MAGGRSSGSVRSGVEPHAQAIPLLLAEGVLKRTLCEAAESRFVFSLNTIDLEHPTPFENGLYLNCLPKPNCSSIHWSTLTNSLLTN